jgi:DNA-binding NarL/FixJ family response regulator
MVFTGADRRRRGRDRRGSREPIRILIVDRQAVYRVGIRGILESEVDLAVVAEADDSPSARARAVETAPDIVLVDLSLPAPGGLETTRRIKRELPTAGLIVMAPSDGDDVVLEALKAGAAALVPKEIGSDDLVAIIRRVASGDYPINDRVFTAPAVASRMLDEFRELAAYRQAGPPIFAPLTAREVEILDAIARGMSNKQVGEALSITEQTVKNHMSNILRKLALNDRTQAVLYALRRGWIALPD